MRFLVLSRGEVVGTSDLPFIDAGMGIVSGAFHPNEHYVAIQPTIRTHNQAEDMSGELREQAFEKARQHIRELDLRIQTVEEEPLNCDFVFLTDFSEELEEDNMEVAVLGFSFEVRQRFWSNECCAD